MPVSTETMDVTIATPALGLLALGEIEHERDAFRGPTAEHGRASKDGDALAVLPDELLLATATRSGRDGGRFWNGRGATR